MNSLRARQLISSFAIIMASILILGMLLFFFTQNQELSKEKDDLEQLGFDLLGYFNFSKGRFQIDPENKDDMEKFLTKADIVDQLSGVESDTVAYIQDTSTKVIQWHSYVPHDNLNEQNERDIAEILISFPTHASPGEKIISQHSPEIQENTTNNNNDRYIIYAYGFQHSPYGKYQLVIAHSAKKLESNTQDMMQHLIYLFIASAILVLFAQLATSYWVIAPVKEFDEEIKRIESGEQETINKFYPEELTPIKSTINTLVQYEVGQKRRYRDALDDLAHSLKTPLSAIQGYLNQDELKNQDSSAIRGIENQLNRMKDIVSYQLKKAVVTKHHALVTPQMLRPVLTRLRESLLKVYHQKNFAIVISVEKNIKIRMDEDDLLELFGNLINNSCRFCEHIVDINARQDGNKVVINIDDDGMGFPDNNPSKLLQRGIRADSLTEGQGIGLAVCTEIIMAAGGSIELLVSPQVGARVRVTLPA
jgi:signal transduction histidine kinase